MPLHLGERTELIEQRCNEYLASRKGTFEFRSIRYAAVGRELLRMGLDTNDTITDIGAGQGMFFRWMTENTGWRGRYIPIDGSIDGTNLETYIPDSKGSDWFVAIEVLEHLRNWEQMLVHIDMFAWRGMVATVPNPRTVDVLGCDPTHVSIVPESAFLGNGWTTEERSFFGSPDDTILAWKKIGG